MSGCCCPHTPTVVVGTTPEPLFGSVAASSVNLAAQLNDTYVPVTSIQIPEDGVYRVWAEVRGVAQGTTNAPGLTAHITARLFNETDSVALPDTETLVTAINSVATGFDQNQGTATVSAFVTGPATIRLEAKRVTSNGSPGLAVFSDANGRTTLHYERIAP